MQSHEILFNVGGFTHGHSSRNSTLFHIVTIWAVFFGVENWRREHQGKRQAELAEEVLAIFYEAIEVVKYVRGPMSFANETADITQDRHETEGQYQARRNASVVFKRFNEHQALFGKLRAMRYRFMATFGREASKPFDDLGNITREIQLAARMLGHLWAQRSSDNFQTEEQRESTNQEIQKNERVFWEWLPEEDTINPKLEAVRADIEKTCRSVIEARGSLYSLLNWKIRR